MAVVGGRTRTLVAVVVGVLAAGSVFAVAAARARSGAAAGSPPPLAIRMVGSDQGELGASGVGAPAVGAPGLGATKQGTGADRPPGAGDGRYVLVGTLPTGPSSAAVVRLGAGGAAPEDVVRRLAGALRLSGTPVRSGAEWSVRSGRAVLRVYGYAGHPWAYARDGVDGCPLVPPMGGPGVGVACVTGGTVSVGGAPQPAPPPPPSDPNVRAAADPVLRAAGLDPSGARVGDGWASVDPVVRGLPTSGLETTVEVDGHGVSTARGWLPDPVEGDTYPLLSARAVFDSLQDEPRPMLACLSKDAPPELSPPSPRTVPSAPAVRSVPGCPFPPVVVTGARLALALAWDAHGPLLVPAWSFSTRHGWPVVRVAVVPRLLVPPTGGVSPPRAVPPTAAPGKPGVAGSGGGSGVAQPVATTSS